MKNIHVATRLFALILSLVLLLGLIPALATEAEPLPSRENLISEIATANQPAQLFERHTSLYRHTDDYSQGELANATDLYATAETAYRIIDGNSVTYATPDRYIDYTTDNGISETLLLPEEYATNLEYVQTYIYYSEDEVVEDAEEQDGDLLVTSKMTDAELLSANLGDEYETEYGDGVEIVMQYRVDGEDLTMKEYTEKVCLPDGSEFPRAHTTFVYDEPVLDPAAPDSPLAPFFDETAEKWQFTVVFAAGTPEERTCQYSVPVDAIINIYHDETGGVYEDAACTQLFTGMDDRMEYTLYIKNAEG